MNASDAATYLELLNGLAALATSAIDNYNKARALAASAGVTEADMADADARFAKVWPDPLDSKP